MATELTPYEFEALVKSSFTADERKTKSAQIKALSSIIFSAQCFLCMVQSEVELLTEDFDPQEWDAALKLLENKIPPRLNNPHVFSFLNIRRGLSRLRQAKNPEVAWNALEDFYQSTQIVLKRLDELQEQLL